MTPENKEYWFQIIGGAMAVILPTLIILFAFVAPWIDDIQNWYDNRKEKKNNQL